MQQAFRGSQNYFRLRGIGGPNQALQVVLDTNVTLDLLVFDDPACLSLESALARTDVRWFATPDMRAEFEEVLSRPALAHLAHRQGTAASAWNRWVTSIETHRISRADSFLRCRDPDDQQFLDLALALRPSVLLSRDKALLVLARAALELGVCIGTPGQFEQWACTRSEGDP